MLSTLAMTNRLTVSKTYKLFINGAFVRSESGRSQRIDDSKGVVLAHLCKASRKDLRDAVEAARKAQAKWAAATAYNRGQILYRMAEMMEGKRDELVSVIAATSAQGLPAARQQVSCAIDRLVGFAGWADKLSQVLGCNNAVAGPYYNFTVPEPTGVVGIVAPDLPPLLGLISLIGPVLCAGNAAVVITSEKHPLPAAVFAEVLATSDVPAGVINILTGSRSELLEPLASHREINAISSAILSKKETEILRLGVAQNIKRVHIAKIKPDQWYDAETCESPWTIEPFVDFKTIWHPSSA